MIYKEMVVMKYILIVCIYVCMYVYNLCNQSYSLITIGKGHKMENISKFPDMVTFGSCPWYQINFRATKRTQEIQLKKIKIKSVLPPIGDVSFSKTVFTLCCTLFEVPIHWSICIKYRWPSSSNMQIRCSFNCKILSEEP